MEDPTPYIAPAQELLKDLEPTALLWLAGAAGFTKLAVSGIKRIKPDLRGNVFLALAAGVAAGATIVSAHLGGVFLGGLTLKEGASIALAAFITWASSVGVNEGVKAAKKSAASIPDAPTLPTEIR